jgi:DNA-binding NarL/FixJ family response regulator
MVSEIDSSQNQKNKITVILADDHPLMRHALRSLLEKQTGFEVVAEVDDGEEAVRLAKELVPDVVIMDISMPKLNGLEATRQIKAECPTIAVLVLTVYDDGEHILGILEAGADGYLTKKVFGERFVQAVRSVASGEAVLSAPVMKQLLKYALRYPIKAITLDAGGKLTIRELEIIKLAARGMGNKDIALKLSLSLRTVKGYLVDIFSKLNAGSRTEAIITALRAGIITLDDLD